MRRVWKWAVVGGAEIAEAVCVAGEEGGQGGTGSGF